MALSVDHLLGSAMKWITRELRFHLPHYCSIYASFGHEAYCMADRKLINPDLAACFSWRLSYASSIRPPSSSGMFYSVRMEGSLPCQCDTMACSPTAMMPHDWSNRGSNNSTCRYRHRDKCKNSQLIGACKIMPGGAHGQSNL